MELRGRTALVTGGGVRVGRELALALAREGMRVLVHYRGSEDEAADTVATIERAGGEARRLRADLARVEEVERLVREAEDAFGGVDVLVNNAAVFPAEPIEETDADLWDQTLAVNLRAPFFLIRALAPAMRARGEGVVINLADLAGIQAWRRYAAHGIAKAGLIHLTRVAARAYAPEVRVAAIAPSTVLPPDSMDEAELERLERGTPLGRLGTPEAVVEAMLYLLRADFVTGDVLLVDGGRMLRC